MKLKDLPMFCQFLHDEVKYVKMNSKDKKNVALVNEDGHAGEWTTVGQNQDIIRCTKKEKPKCPNLS